MASDDSQSLGGLTVSWLTKWIRQQLEQFPVEFLPLLGVGQLTVSDKLTINDQIVFKSYGITYFIGQTGTPVFTNSWVNLGAPYAGAGFMRLPDGWVALVGAIKSGAVGSAAFTLPPGLRPKFTQSLLTLSNGTTGRVDIGADGTVTPLSPSSNLSVVLDGLRFKAA